MKQIIRILLRTGYCKGGRGMNLTELQERLRSMEDYISAF